MSKLYPYRVQGEGQTPPQFAFCESDSFLNIVFYNVATATFTLSARLLINDGEIVIFQKTFSPLATGVVSAFRIPLTEGRLISATIDTATGTPKYAETYCVLELYKGTLTTGQLVQTLASGYVTIGLSVSFPFGGISSPSSGSGGIQFITQGAPLAGTNVSLLFPSVNRRALLRAAYYVLQTDATAIGRQVFVHYGPYAVGGGYPQMWTSPLSVVIPPSSTLVIYATLDSTESIFNDAVG